MNCDNVREHLDAYLSRELDPGLSAEIARHLEECSECAAELAARERVRDTLRKAVGSAAVPAGLEERVRVAVRQRSTRPRTGLWAVAAAALVILGVALAGLWRGRANPEEAILRKTTGRFAAILRVGLIDHLECAVFRKFPRKAAPPDQLAADLGAGFAELAPLVQAKLPSGVHLIEAHHCGAAGREYTHFILGNEHELISLILTRKRPAEWMSNGIYQQGVDRFQVVGFESHEYLIYVISDLKAEQNLQWAAGVAPTLREYLAAHQNNT